MTYRNRESGNSYRVDGANVYVRFTGISFTMGEHKSSELVLTFDNPAQAHHYAAMHGQKVAR